MLAIAGMLILVLILATIIFVKSNRTMENRLGRALGRAMYPPLQRVSTPSLAWDEMELTYRGGGEIPPSADDVIISEEEGV